MRNYLAQQRKEGMHTHNRNEFLKRCVAQNKSDTRVCTVWFHWCEFQQAKPTHGDRNHNNDCLRKVRIPRRGKRNLRAFGNGNKVLLTCCIQCIQSLNCTLQICVSHISFYLTLKSKLGIPWWSSGYDSVLSLPGFWIQSLVRELGFHKLQGAVKW